MASTPTNTLCVGSGVTLVPYITALLSKISIDLHQPLHSVFSMMCASGEGTVPLMMIACRCFDESVCLRIFNTPEHSDRPNSTRWDATMYRGHDKEQVLRAHFNRLRLSDVFVPICISLRNIGGQPMLVRSWDTSYANVEIVDVLMAATARPTVYPPVMIQGQLCIGDFTDNLDAPVRLAMEASDNLSSPKLLEITMNVHHEEKCTKLLRMHGGTSHTGYVFWDQMGIGQPEFFTRDEDCKVTILRKLLGTGNVMSISYASKTESTLNTHNYTRAAERAMDIWNEYRGTILTWLTSYGDSIPTQAVHMKPHIPSIDHASRPLSTETTLEDLESK